jgi:hypothetical protein
MDNDDGDDEDENGHAVPCTSARTYYSDRSRRAAYIPCAVNIITITITSLITNYGYHPANERAPLRLQKILRARPLLSLLFVFISLV